MTPNDYLTVGRGANGKPLFRVRVLAALANIFGIQFHIGGWPYGAPYSRSVNGLAEGPDESANG